MFINKAKNFDSILNNYESGKADCSQVELSFKLHRNAMQFLLKHRNKQPDLVALRGGIEHIKTATGVELSTGQLSEILTLFPSERIKLAEYGISDTEVRECMYNVACCFFAGCEAPTYGDGIDMDRFIKHLQGQAKIMGYSCLEESFKKTKKGGENG